MSLYRDVAVVVLNTLLLAAALEGAALGGGWELALLAHARFALDKPSISLGLPEVTLGLIPGATGITKMTRLLGLMAAQPYLMEGKLMSPAKAHELGLVHGLADSSEDLKAMALQFIAAHESVAQPWDVKGFKMPGGSNSRSPRPLTTLKSQDGSSLASARNFSITIWPSRSTLSRPMLSAMTRNRANSARLRIEAEGGP